MNEFTKEELEWLLDDIEASLKYEDEDLPFKIRDKIRSMIENYCEHQDNGEAEVFVDICKKCNFMMIRNKTLREYNDE
jgi:hypothetical protein